MADVREVITKFTVDDQFTARVQNMARVSQGLGRSVEDAQRRMQQGFRQFGSAMGLPVGTPFAMLAGQQIGQLGAGARAFAASGGLFSDLVTTPLRAAGSFLRMGASISALIPGVGILAGAVLGLASVIMDVANAAIAALAKTIEWLGGVAFKVGGVLAVAFAGILAKATQTALAFDQLERSFGAFLGSPEKGRQAAAFIEARGLTSPFEQQALQEAARSILAVNLSLSQFLPVVERIALRRGVSTEGLLEVARIIMQVAGGATGEAFGPQGLGRFGISRTMLAGFGATFNRQGQFEGTPEDALRVLLAMANSPEFARITEAFNDSPAVKFSNAMDAINKALRDMGTALLPRVVPLVESFANAMLKVSASGILGDAIKVMGEGFARLFGSGLSQGATLMERIAALSAAVIANIPLLAQSIGQTIASLFNRIKGFLEGILLSLRYLPFVGGLFESPLRFAQGLGEGLFGGAFDDLRGVFDKIRGDYSSFLDRIRSADPNAIANVEDPSADRALGAGAAGTRSALALGAGALATLARDFRRFALGGGDVGRLGLTDVDLARIGAVGGQPEVRVRVQVVGAGNFEEMFRRLFEQFAREYEEQRVRVLAPSLGGR